MFTFHTQVRFSLLLALGFGLLTGCFSPKEPAHAEANYHAQTVAFVEGQSDLPKFLPRHEGIGSAAEQEKMFRTYMELKQGIAADPTDYRKQLQMAQVFMLEARATGEHGYYYPAALGVLEKMLSQDINDEVRFAATSLKASVYLSLHRFQDALELAEYAVSLNGHNALIYGSLVDANVELGDYERAVEMADKMTSIRPDLRSYSRVSYLREIYGDMPGAIEAMKLAIQSGVPGYEDYAWCRLTLGGLYENSGYADSARMQYEFALLERENYPFARAALANLHMNRKDYEAAENELNQAIATIPEVGFYEQLVELYRATGREEKAEETLAEVLEMLADDEEKGHRMGMEYADVYLNLIGNAEKAFPFALNEYNSRPQNLDANRLMAEVLYTLGKTEEALSYVDTALRTDSQNPRLLCIAGLVYVANGKVKVGKAMMQTSLELNPNQGHPLAQIAQKSAASTAL